ncbi:RNA polymerase factor sigma-54 [Telmatospirillum sp. J64-1]|uniref:RNA polymerase factor sigma-54 n=1 Tax=Telmatospirillum sp. J64-1 TaxID=2502183 RepID=UPI00115F078D|nr:RNA polymerase factor sigma-54 [Telmatospirillum sp. J64-1]
MALTPRLDLRQTQSLVMTPQLQQAIKLLQLSNLELSAFIEQELERNPLLQREDGEDGGNDEHVPPAEDRTGDSDGAMLDAMPGRDETPLDVDYDNTFNNDSASDGHDGERYEGGEAFAEWGRGGGQGFDGGGGDFEQMVSGEVSLHDHLVEQLNLDLPDPADRIIGLHLIEMLDEVGYLRGDLNEVAELLGCPLEKVEAVLARLQHFDPAGLFARSLSECLALQLRDRNRLDPAMQALLDNLDMLARRDLPGLLRVCGVDSEDLAEMIGEIKALNPKPALAFDHVVAQPVTPDVLMRPVAGGEWLVELNNETLPRVLVDTRYHAKVSAASLSKEDKTYLSEQFQSANWLVKSLHQRATTILKVASEIVRQQDAFFAKGVQHLRPLVLRDIAQAIGMHESTVSRVTANKYIATPRGIYELKYFFTQAIAASAGGEAHSAEAVRHRIKSLIDAETPKEVLSDDRIVEILKEDGIDIARRTVAKYREAMRIPSSVQRRREKALGV